MKFPKLALQPSSRVLHQLQGWTVHVWGVPYQHIVTGPPVSAYWYLPWKKQQSLLFSWERLCDMGSAFWLGSCSSGWLHCGICAPWGDTIFVGLTEAWFTFCRFQLEKSRSCSLMASSCRMVFIKVAVGYCPSSTVHCFLCKFLLPSL